MRARAGLAIGLVVVSLHLLAPAPSRAVTATPTACTPRILVLAAFPGELGPFLKAAGTTQRVVAENRAFYLGRLHAHNVIMAMTGIGLVNATQTTNAAFRRFPCITRVVFSGVAGGGPDNFIGDVTVPQRWTIDGGRTWLAVDPAMLATAQGIGPLPFLRKTPLGDPVCACIDPDLIKTVDIGRNPELRVGGDGSSSDSFEGKAFPCVPFGGDVFGCEPCVEQRHSTEYVRQVARLRIFLDPQFILANILPQPGASQTFVAVDNETAAAQVATSSHSRPFLAFRAMSDGHGDPLHLPGFPAQFFFYKQLAADNAAIATLAFLRAWPGQ